jgi:type IV pilus assembly protein PilA
MRRKRTQKGFSLIELLIVVAIIVLIITMALPKYRDYIMNTNETAAVASLRAVNQAQIMYQSKYPTRGFAESLSGLGNGNQALGANCVPSPEAACLLDPVLGTGVKQGYRFTMQAGNPVNNIFTTYGAGAAPLNYSKTGMRLFCTTEEQQIRFDANVGGSTTPPSPTMCGAGAFTPFQ